MEDSEAQPVEVVIDRGEIIYIEIHRRRPQHHSNRHRSQTLSPELPRSQILHPEHHLPQHFLPEPRSISGENDFFGEKYEIRKRNTRNQRKLSNPCFAVGSSFAISDGKSTTEISSNDLSEYLRDETVEIDTGNSSVETEKSLDAAGVAVRDRRGQRSWEPAIASCFLPLSLPAWFVGSVQELSDLPRIFLSVSRWKQEERKKRGVSARCGTDAGGRQGKKAGRGRGVRQEERRPWCQYWASLKLFRNELNWKLFRNEPDRLAQSSRCLTNYRWAYSSESERLQSADHICKDLQKKRWSKRLQSAAKRPFNSFKTKY
ncbi:hypothetical protein LXL04_029797 [Taraxacum kok-saghyz]